MDISVLIIFAVAVFIGWHLRGLTILSRLSNDPDHFIKILEEIRKINEKEDKESTQSTIGTELTIERHGEVLYAFTKDTKDFIAQGPTLPDLIEAAQKRFPGRKFFGYISKEDSAKELV